MEDLFKTQLPTSYESKVVEFQPTEGGFSAIIRAKCKVGANVEKWVTEYSVLTNSRWCVQKTYNKNEGSRLAFRQIWVCERSDHVQKRRCRRIMEGGCKARMDIKIQLDTPNTRRNKDVKDGYFATIQLTEEHNHKCSSAQSTQGTQIETEVMVGAGTESDDGSKEVEHPILKRACSTSQDSIVPHVDSQPELRRHWITVFGCPMSQQKVIDCILKEFGKDGNILQHEEDPNGNWIHLRFESINQAEQALLKNGQLFEFGIEVHKHQMRLAVVPCLDEALHEGFDVDQNATSLVTPQGHEEPCPSMEQLGNLDDGDWDGWNLDNYEAVFDEFIQANGIPVSYKYTPVGFGEHSAIIAEIMFTMNRSKSFKFLATGIEIYARAEGKTKQIASAKCALKVVHDLYSKKLIEIELLCEQESTGRPLSSTATTESASSSTTVPQQMGKNPTNYLGTIKEEVFDLTEQTVEVFGENDGSEASSGTELGEPVVKKKKLSTAEPSMMSKDRNKATFQKDGGRH